MRRFLVVVAVVAAMALSGIIGLGAGLFLSGTSLASFGAAGAAGEPAEFEVFWEAWNTVERHFVDREALDETAMTYGAIRGMVQALGDEGHTAFLTPQELEAQRTDLSGKFSGIGAQLGVRDSLPIIVAPFDGSPADQAGVKAGDIIMKVDGVDVTTMALSDIVSRIRGEEGTEVVLSLLRPDEQRSVEVTITRGEIKVPAASWAMVPGTDVALIRLSQFTANAETDIKASLEEAEAEGATSLIVDVRNNPGGLLEQAINVTSQFLTDGDVLLEEDAEGNRKSYPVKPGGMGTELPLVVLINPGSASSSEILAGAVQDHERGTLVGETTFGTGTVLQPYPLSDGSALMLGTRQWLTPEGRLIRKQGISPDEVVVLPIETNLLTPEEIEEMTPEELVASDDLQLLKALDLLGAEMPEKPEESEETEGTE